MNYSSIVKVIATVFWQFFPALFLSLILYLFTNTTEHNALPDFAFITTVMYGQVIMALNDYNKSDRWALYLASISGFSIVLVIASFASVEKYIKMDLLVQPTFTAWLPLMLLSLLLMFIIDKNRYNNTP